MRCLACHLEIACCGNLGNLLNFDCKVTGLVEALVLFLFLRSDCLPLHGHSVPELGIAREHREWLHCKGYGKRCIVEAFL